MTTVTLTPMSEGYLFECSGHACYSEKGSDIVCAGISALCIALVSVTEELAGENDLHVISSHFSDGYLCIEAVPEEDPFSKERFETVFRTVMAGFEAIEEMYPENLRVEE